MKLRTLMPSVTSPPPYETAYAHAFRDDLLFPPPEGLNMSVLQHRKIPHQLQPLFLQLSNSSDGSS
jgi:hypothetical protein